MLCTTTTKGLDVHAVSKRHLVGDTCIPQRGRLLLDPRPAPCPQAQPDQPSQKYEPSHFPMAVHWVSRVHGVLRIYACRQQALNSSAWF